MSNITRIALQVEYNGKHFHGWQAQSSEGIATVQEALETAVAEVADHPVKLFCAGRTDTGVHATGQIVHFDTTAQRELKAWVMGVNTLLPDSVCVHWSQEVSSQFHARFSAQARRYCYLIDNGPVRPAIFNGLVTQTRMPLDETLMHEAGQYLIGELDFTSYRGSNCQSPTPMRNVIHLNVYRHGERVIIDIMANAFLLHMVRNITGVLMEVGFARKPPEWAREVLEARNRSSAAVTAPPDGLYLVDVVYPPEYGLPVLPPKVPILNRLPD